MTNDQGLGVRMTYWRYDHGGNAQTFVSDGINLPGATVTTVIFPAAIIAPVAGDVLSTSNQLATNTPSDFNCGVGFWNSGTGQPGPTYGRWLVL